MVYIGHCSFWLRNVLSSTVYIRSFTKPATTKWALSCGLICYRNLGTELLTGLNPIWKVCFSNLRYGTVHLVLGVGFMVWCSYSLIFYICSAEYKVSNDFNKTGQCMLAWIFVVVLYLLHVGKRTVRSFYHSIMNSWIVSFGIFTNRSFVIKYLFRNELVEIYLLAQVVLIKNFNFKKVTG